MQEQLMQQQQQQQKGRVLNAVLASQSSQQLASSTALPTGDCTPHALPTLPVHVTELSWLLADALAWHQCSAVCASQLCAVSQGSFQNLCCESTAAELYLELKMATHAEI
jgi:hypothetical protein